MFNGGPGVTSSAYGSAVGGVAQGIYGSLDVTVTHKDSTGKTAGKETQKVPVRPAKGAKKLH
jgi:hypothetical protein